MSTTRRSDDDARGSVVRIRVDNAGIDSTIYRIPGGSGGDAAVYKRGGQAPSNETVPMEWSVYGLGFVGVSRQTGEQEEGPVCFLKSCLASALVHEIV